MSPLDFLPGNAIWITVSSVKMIKVYRAPWVIPVTAPTIADGCVVVRDGIIRQVGPYSQIGNHYDDVNEVDGVIVPSLINCHAHLELSYLADTTKGWQSFEDITQWIRCLLAERFSQNISQDDIIRAGCESLENLYQQGVSHVLDIANNGFADQIGANSLCHVTTLLEILGLAEASCSEAKLRLKEIQVATTAHAPYSTHPELVRLLKKRSSRMKQIFSIHTAESSEEQQFLLTGEGPFRDFLEERRALDGSFKYPGMTSVAYLDSLKVLDDKSLCVHCVHVSEEDMEILARRKTKV